MEVFTKFTNFFDAAVKNLQKTSADQTQKCQNHYKREFQTIGKSFIQMGQALQQEGNFRELIFLHMHSVVDVMSNVKLYIKYFFLSAESTNLTNAVTCTGEAYEDIAKMYDDQPKNDWEPLGDIMHDYRGILASWPGMLQVHSVRIF